MTSSPLAAAAYGVASVIGASPQARVRALSAGGAADALILGATPFGASRPGKITSPRTGLPVQQFDTPAIRYRELNAGGQASGVNSTLSRSLIGTGTKAYWRRTPPGWQGNREDNNQARAHLQGRQLGGDGRDARNLVTMTHQGANTPQMRDFENAVARRVAGGEVVAYGATPIYGGGVGPPSSVLLTVHGPNGSSARYVHNPAGAAR
jgi:DNA/RNA non-specific endonuclease